MRPKPIALLPTLLVLLTFSAAAQEGAVFSAKIGETCRIENLADGHLIMGMHTLSNHGIRTPIVEVGKENIKHWKCNLNIPHGQSIQKGQDIRLQFFGRYQSPSDGVGLSPETAEGFLKKVVAPVYPKLAWTARIYGDVLIDAAIDASGNVARVKVISGHPMLTSSALQAIRQWKYRPLLVEGKRLGFSTSIHIHFDPA